MRSVVVSAGRITETVAGPWPRGQRPAASGLRPLPCTHRAPRRALLPPAPPPPRAAPEDTPRSDPAAGESSSASPRSDPRATPHETAAEMPRQPADMSGGAGLDLGYGVREGSQSERAATAAAEANVAEALPAAQQRQQQQPRPDSPSQQPLKVSDFRMNPRISEVLEEAAAVESAMAAADPAAATATAAGAAAAHLHVASHSIEVLRMNPHEFGCDEPSTCGGTIVLALDDTDDAAAAVDWVATNLYTPGADELRVVHVVCDPRTLQWQTSVGTSASGRPIALSSLELGLSHAPGGHGDYGDVEIDLHDYIARLNKAAEAVVARRCDSLRKRGVKYEMELPRLPTARSAAGIAETLMESVRRNDAKLLVVASHGPGALAEYGSVSRFCYQHSSVPLLLMPSPETQEAAAAEAARRAPGGGAAGSKTGSKKTGSEILLVVNHLEELANVWQWVVDNCARKGDSLSIQHVAGPSISGMPSLPTAIANQMRRRGLGDCTYRMLYSANGDPQDLGDQVCRLAASNPAVKLVVLLNYSRRGLIQEALHGSIASHLSRHCPKPLLLLQLPE